MQKEDDYINTQYDKIDIGSRIRIERKAAGFKSASSFAERLNIGRSQVEQIEQGKRLPDLDTLVKMAEIFNCEVGYLLCEQGYEECKTRLKTDIQKETGLSEDCIMRLKDISKTDSNVKSAVYEFLDDLLDNICLMDMAIAYKQFKNGELSDCVVVKSNGAVVDLFGNDLPLIVLQNKFTEFVRNCRDENKFSWKQLRKEQAACIIEEDELDDEYLSNVECGK